jgi:hypothetical protein
MVARRGTVGGAELTAPVEVWEMILSKLRHFELGSRHSYRGPPSKALFTHPPSQVYTGPTGATAAAWCAALQGTYESDRHRMTMEAPHHADSDNSSADQSSCGRLRSTYDNGPVLALELTSNSRRLRAVDVDVDGVDSRQV